MDAKRGFVPEDERNFSADSLIILKKASRHITWLLNEGYDIKQACTFVGNHFLLSERQRLAAARSTAAEIQLEKRREKRLDMQDLNGKTVWIDGFNVIITLEVMLSRSVLLECMDGAIRDLAALRGTYRIIPETREAVRMMIDILKSAGVEEIHILLDEPVSNSGRLKALIADAGEAYPFGLDIRVQKNVDRELYDKDCVISSDSLVLDHCRSWFSLAGECLKNVGAPVIRVWGE